MSELLREELAKLEHQQWMEWAQSLMEEEDLSQERVERWEEYMVPYEALDFETQNHDRKWAESAMEIMKKECSMGGSMDMDKSVRIQYINGDEEVLEAHTTGGVVPREGDTVCIKQDDLVSKQWFTVDEVRWDIVNDVERHPDVVKVRMNEIQTTEESKE